MTKSRDIADSINRIDSSAADATAVTIDANENVLVGKTSQTIDTVGAELLGSIGKVHATRDGGASAGFNRLSDDGNIAVFYKDGSTVGSIGSRGSGTSFITLKASSGSGSGLTGSDNRILPMDESALADNNTDLGMSSYRFKDLYLGGSVYLGGTGSANALDDYEEGTFTVTVRTDATGAFSAETGEYTKIGRMVYVRINFNVSTNFTDNKIAGLPFTPAGDSGVSTAVGTFPIMTNSANDEPIMAYLLVGQDYVQIVSGTHNADQHQPNTTNDEYRFSAWYFV